MVVPDGGGPYRRRVHIPPVDPRALRRGTLAASVLDDIPLEPGSDGVLVGCSWDGRSTWTPAAWSDLAMALVGADPESDVGRLRLRDWLRAHALLSATPQAAARRLVALALPRTHALHPGPTWVREPVLGGVLDLGLGLRREDDVVAPVPAGPLARAGLEPDWGWAAARAHLDAMAALVVDRLRRDGRGVVRPVGGCDVLTVLSSRVLRQYLATGDGTGMRAVASPMRSRCWFDLARIDPAFVGAAAAATDPEHRGVAVPLLVTVDEVAVTPASAAASQLARAALADAAGRQDMHERDVLYR